MAQRKKALKLSTTTYSGEEKVRYGAILKVPYMSSDESGSDDDDDEQPENNHEDEEPNRSRVFYTKKTHLAIS